MFLFPLDISDIYLSCVCLYTHRHMLHIQMPCVFICVHLSICMSYIYICHPHIYTGHMSINASKDMSHIYTYDVCIYGLCTCMYIHHVCPEWQGVYAHPFSVSFYNTAMTWAIEDTHGWWYREWTFLLHSPLLSCLPCSEISSGCSVLSTPALPVWVCGSVFVTVTLPPMSWLCFTSPECKRRSTKSTAHLPIQAQLHLWGSALMLGEAGRGMRTSVTPQNKILPGPHLTPVPAPPRAPLHWLCGNMSGFGIPWN